MMSKELICLKLVFPSGISMKTCEQIARAAQEHSSYGVTEGGYEMLSNPLASDDDEIKFSTDTACYVYGTEKRKR
jgi:hypothetical protein